MTITLTQARENITGSDCTGTDGGLNRTYTLAAADSVSNSIIIIVQGAILTPINDFTESNGIITFINGVYDTDIIVIYYLTEVTSGASGSSYTNASLVEAEVRASTSFSPSTTPSLSELNTWIEEVSKEIETKTGEVYDSTAVTDILFDYDGSGIFYLPTSSLISINKVEYNTNTINSIPSWITLQEGGIYDYITYLPEGEIHFCNGVSSSNKVSPSPGKQRLRIGYTYGYSTIPLEIQRLATLLVAKRVILSLINSQANTEGGEIQIGTIRITDPSNYGIQYMKSINDEIDRVYRDIGNGLKTFRLTRVYDL